MIWQTNDKDEWLDRAFRLAYFLHGNRETAKRIAASAMNKLETASTAQFKRIYYTPTGATRSRVSLNDLQLLQRLVLVESEVFEREGEASEASLVKFFVKHLVRISLKRNSFYVTLGVARILHNYATADAMNIYNVVVQDPERVHDDYYYRSRKGVLMKELKARFGELLQIVRTARGEERFAGRGEKQNLEEIAHETLVFLTPWNSPCAVPEKFDPFDDVIKPFCFDKKHPDEEHKTEVVRIHAAVHPRCFARLTSALKLPPSEEKMEIPKFMLTFENINDNHRDRHDPPSLDADELSEIKEILKQQAASRKAASAGFLRVSTDDGSERARLDLAETGTARFVVDDGAEVIEVYADGADGETLLAAHVLNYEELRRGATEQTVKLEGGQKITFSLAPLPDESGEVAEINCVVLYAETALRRRFALALRRAGCAAGSLFGQPYLKPLAAFGLIFLAVVFGWLVLRNTGANDDRIANKETPFRNSEANVLPPAPPQEELAVNSNTAPPNEKTPLRESPQPDENRQTAKKPFPSVKEKPKPSTRFDQNLKSPPNETANNFRRDETDENGVLRLPVSEGRRRGSDDETTSRAFNPKINGKPLGEIKFVYLETTGDPVLGKIIAERISSELGKSSRFVITPDKEQADAALKIYIRHESDGETREDASVAAIVRLVNARGFVVYPNRKRVSGWKYVGTIAKLPSRIARDLVEAK